MSDRETLLEFIVLGDFAKVSAIDAETGIEVSVIGPANAARVDLERLAVGKLERRLKGPAGGPGPRRKRPGTVV
jgi:hypothetical protein